MKKILIYISENELSHCGGPLGYNYNLLIGLNSIRTHNICVSFLNNRPVSNRIGKYINNWKPSIFKYILITLKSILKKGRDLYGPSRNPSVDLSQFDAVHFHQSYDMYLVRKALDNYKGKVILTSHMPEKPSKEIYDRLSEFEKRRLSWFYKRLYKIDEYSINRADYMIFPCEESEESYYDSWEQFKFFKDHYPNRIYYVPTGTQRLDKQMTKEEVRNKYHIPFDAFVIGFVGRHNEIKGYDVIKKIGETLLSQTSNVYFLVAGREEPLMGLHRDRWIEVGWTNDPGSILNAVDICMIPNKQTYFDLVMLEVLSLGRLVVASETGGNRYFSRFDDIGVFLYKDEVEAMEIIHKLMNISEKKRTQYESNNKKIYEECFCLNTFAQKYIDTVTEIMDV